MVPRNPLRKRRVFLFFHNIRFIFSTLGNPRKMAWFLKNLPALTLMAHIKKSDIRGNFRGSQFENNKMKRYQASGSTGFTFYSPFPTCQCTHLCSFSLYHTSACGGAAPTWTSPSAPWLGISSFTFSHREALLASSLPPLRTSYISPLGVPSSQLTRVSSLYQLPPYSKVSRKKN